MTEHNQNEQAALANPDVQAGLEDASNGRTVQRRRPANVPADKQERGPRFAPKLDAAALELLEKVKLFNAAGLGMTHAEYIEQATAHAAEQASKWVARQFEKEYASIRRNDQ